MKGQDFYSAKIGYEAYCKATDGKSLVTGDPLPAFKDLPEAIKMAWVAVADAFGDLYY